VKFAAEDSWRGVSNNLRLSSLRRWVTSVETRRRSWESARKQLHDNVGEVVQLWRPSWGGVRNDSNRWRRCVVDWTVFRTLNTSPGVVGSEQTSANSDKLFDSRPAVLFPFIACRTVPALVLLCKLFVFPYSSICVNLLNCHFYIFLIIPLTTRHPNHNCGTSFRRLKRSMVARLGARLG